MLGKINASLNKELQAVEWGEYVLGDLFEINPTKYYRLPNDEIISFKGKTPLVSNKSINNGVMGFSELEPLNRGSSISCSDTTLGAETMYFQDKDYIGYQHIQAFLPKFQPFNKSIASFIISSARVATSNGQYDYGHKFNRVAMRNTRIFLPTKNHAIDFDFMEKFISELEAQRVAELEVYFSVTGLKDTELSIAEKQALVNFDKLEWGKFNLQALYGKSTRGKRLKSTDRIPGSLPFVTAGEADEGVSDFIGNDVHVFSKNTTTIDMFGSAKYRNYEYGGDDHVAIVHTEKLPMRAAIFVTTAIHKSSHNGQFDYGRNFYAKDADALNIVLPVKNGEPDYDKMETIISAIHKLVVKEVVLYADRKSKAIIEVVSRNNQIIKDGDIRENE